MIKLDPNLPEAEVLEIYKASCTKAWTASENQKLLEAYKMCGSDYSAISLHVGTKSKKQVHSKLVHLQ